jgi:GNAT superfamily N-acetyltransferase
MYQFVELKIEELNRIQDIIPENVILYSNNCNNKVKIIGVYLKDVIIGILIIECAKECLGVVYLFVKKKYRREGIGSVLLKKMEKIAHSLNLNLLIWEMRFKYPAVLFDIYKNFLLKNGWEEPFLKKIFVAITGTKIKEKKWYQDRIPVNYRTLFWRDLNKKYIDQIRFYERKYEDCLTPLAVELDLIDDHSTILLIDESKDKLIGWMVNQRGMEKFVLFRRLYIIPEYRGKNLFFPLLCSSITKVINRDSKGYFFIEGKNIKMKNTILRLMGDIAEEIREFYYSKKKLEL